MCDCLEISLRLSERNRRFQSSDHGEGMPASISLRALRYERHPDHAIAGGETERCGEDAHDLRCLAIYKNRLLKNCWICIESRFPEIFSDYSDLISSIPSLGCIEQAA